MCRRLLRRQLDATPAGALHEAEGAHRFVTVQIAAAASVNAHVFLLILPTVSQAHSKHRASAALHNFMWAALFMRLKHRKRHGRFRTASWIRLPGLLACTALPEAAKDEQLVALALLSWSRRHEHVHPGGAAEVGQSYKRRRRSQESRTVCWLAPHRCLRVPCPQWLRHWRCTEGLVTGGHRADLYAGALHNLPQTGQAEFVATLDAHRLRVETSATRRRVQRESGARLE